MSLKLQIALRNVLRNRRRTVLNMLMIAAGIAAIVVFKGFTHNLITKLQSVAIKNQYGHLQVASNKTWDLSVQDKPKDRLIQIDPELQKQITALPTVAYSSGRLSFYGMISTGEQSVSAHGIGYDPNVEVQMRDSMAIIDGRNFNADSKFEIIMGKGLRDEIGLKVGSQVTLMTYTFDGSVNAIDSQVVGVFQSGLAEVDNSTFFLTLATAQKLLDTNSFERLVVQLKRNEDLYVTKDQLTKLVPAGMSPRAWDELAVYYRQVVEYFGTQNLIIQWILMLLALLAIGNIVGMSIAERTGEIGTIRAMGDSRVTVITQFLLEGLILGILGGFFGCILGYVLILVVNAAHIPIITPGASLPLDMEADIIVPAFASAMIYMCLTAVFATLIPAFRASRIEIVEALKRNI